MAAVVVQQPQQPNDKVTVDLANSKVIVKQDNKETKNPSDNPSEKEEKKQEVTQNTKNDKVENKEQRNEKEKQEAPKGEQKEQHKSEENQKDNKDKTKTEIKKEVEAQQPVLETIQLPVPKPSRYRCFIALPYANGYASEVNKRLYEYEKVKSNQAAAMQEAIRLHNGDPSNTCVFFQSACLRAIGVPVPNHIGYTSVLWNWLEDNNWEMHRDFGNIQKGDIIFAGEYHTMCFMGWKDKARGIAYVMGNEAYSVGDAYSNRNLNGQKAAEENGWNNQYRATRYYKYKGTPIKGDSNSDTKDMSNVIYDSEYHKFTVTPLKGTVTAKQDVYANEKPFPTTEGITPVGLAHGGDKFKVTGKASNGWYEILYNGKKAYISNKYTNFLEEKDSSSDKDVKPVKPTTPTQPTKPDKPNNTTDEKNKPEKTPVDQTKPTEPSKPSETSKSDGKDATKPTKTDQSNDQANQTDKNKPSKPVETNKPEKPNKPVEPAKPVKPSKPAEKPTQPKPVETVIKTAYIKANGGLWLHSTPSTSSSSRMSLMNNGVKVTILDDNGSWYKVDYNGNTGWCSKDYLTNPVETKVQTTKPSDPIEPVAKPSKPTESVVKISYVKANGGLWLHSSKDSYVSSRVTIMDKDSKVTILEESGSWYKVNYNGQTGWCSGKYLTEPKALVNQDTKPSEVSKPVTPTKPTEPIKPVEPAKPVKPNKPVESTIKTAHIRANGGLWLHSSKDSYVSSRLTIMDNGENVQILDEDGSWYKVNYNGKMGWCSSKFLSDPTTITTSKPSDTIKEVNHVEPSKPVEKAVVESTVKTAYVKANGGLWLHSSMDSSSSSRMSIMGNGKKVTILDESGSWYKVDYNGQIGWCSSQFLTSPKSSSVITTPTSTKPSSKTAYVQANGGLWLHSSQSTSASSRLTIMSNGEKVKVLDENGSWYKVDYKGNIGWCSSQFID
ncbi:SH3 domain-containing protein [Clostridium sp. B9]|uniref:SH3 domain-containing protein n=1 Tax=Clostridium sp. B9 TaxID=3423224 RepID=UPI003D2EEBA2